MCSLGTFIKDILIWNENSSILIDFGWRDTMSHFNF